jgi:hypothetical protein
MDWSASTADKGNTESESDPMLTYRWRRAKYTSRWALKLDKKGKAKATV